MSFSKDPSYEWKNHAHKDFTIQVRAWRYPGTTDNDWTWNVYVYVYDTHPLFSLERRASLENLPFHGGCTFDEAMQVQPLFHGGLATECLKIGCDYSHYGDDRYQRCHPKDGIPPAILRDTYELIEAMTECYDGPAL